MQIQNETATARRIIIAAALLVAITIGMRNTLGLFLSPINTATGLGLASISFAWAVSQLVWGISQPIAGELAARIGVARVIALGAILLAASTALLPLATSTPMLLFVFGALSAAGTAVGGVPLLLGAVAQRVAPKWRGLTSGIVGAGSSAGQLVVAPAAQAAISSVGWIPAVFGLSVLALCALPLASAFRAPKAGSPADAAQADAVAPNAVAAQPGLGEALRNPVYWVLTGAYAVCGFHIAFLFAHMPNVIALCGLPTGTSGIWLASAAAFNIVGSIASGILTQRVPMALTLSVVYGLRALGVAAFVLAPKTPTVFLVFSAWMGLTYFAVMPPTSGLIGRLVAARHFATLFGITMLVHQVGSFVGVWVGGIVVDAQGSYDMIWKIDIALAVFAALIHLVVREREGTARIGLPGLAVAAPSLALARL